MMTPIEAMNASTELAQHFRAIAELDTHPTTNAAALAFHHAEAAELLWQLQGHLAFQGAAA